jgi:hypothetical protein
MTEVEGIVSLEKRLGLVVGPSEESVSSFPGENAQNIRAYSPLDPSPTHGRSSYSDTNSMADFNVA